MCIVFGTSISFYDKKERGKNVKNTVVSLMTDIKIEGVLLMINLIWFSQFLDFVDR